MGPQEDIHLRTLREHWGYADFRGVQRRIIESVCGGRDTLGLMPTGGGKSITFQVPALEMGGTCIVITPLIALMRDQVQALRKRGVLAAAIHGHMSRPEIVATLENAIFGGVKILYVSPERLSSELFRKKLSHMDVSLITVDEAHCISQWGHDFRPSYREIAGIRSIRPGCPVLALTASATPRVARDIQAQLGFREDNVIRMSFHRDNLAYVVRESADKEADALGLLGTVDGPAIVYVRSRERSREVSGMLRRHGISSTFYNAGLGGEERDARQEAWLGGDVRVMVATTAFGMGIDKPDVRLVLHMDCPDSLEAYFQEAGRAGRDGLPSWAVMLHDGRDDAKLRERVRRAYPDREYLMRVYDHLAYFFQVGMGSGGGCLFDFDIDRFCRAFGHFRPRLVPALNILARAGYISFEEEAESLPRLVMLVSRDGLYGVDGLDDGENRVITAMLRNYGGLFSGYRHVDEGLLARQAGMTADGVHGILVGLGKRGLLHFIPGRKIPRLAYARRREDSAHLEFPREAYGDRKAEFAERVEAVIAYAANGRDCRSRQLLAYFGEEAGRDCGRCDACLAGGGLTG